MHLLMDERLDLADAKINGVLLGSASSDVP